MLIALRQSAGIQLAAAQRLGVERSTLCRFIQKHQLLQIEIQALTGEICDIAETQLIAAIRNKEPWAIRYYLDNFGMERGFGKRKLAFRDEDATLMMPATFVAPGRMDPADWEAKYGAPASPVAS